MMTPEETKALATELIAQAKRLGLTWGMRMAAVVTVSPLQATFDGDDETPMPMVSMIGTLHVGARVHVVTVPPAGNYIVGQARAYESGEESISFTAQTSATVTVTFTNPFLLTPRVFCNINSGSGSTSGWQSRAFNVSTTGFTLFVFGSSNTWSAVNVYWAAFAP